jgi:molecular chaperone DnaJ
MSSKRCFYEVLGVAREASADEIRRAYKQLALKHHPDRNQGNAEAEAAFKEVNAAYQILSDDEKRRLYDQFGHAAFDGSMGAQGFGGMGGMGDVFSHMQDLFSEMFAGGVGGFGRPQQRRGGDLRVQQRLTLQEAAFGAKKELTVHAPARCGDCGGSGARPGTKPETCPHCRGAGHVSNARGFVMFTATCPRCQGQGGIIKHPCKACDGHGVVEKPRRVVVTFPAGVDAGQKLRVPGQGLPGPNGAQPGDLYVDIDVEEDARFERDGADLVTRAVVSFADAALGATIEVPVLSPEREDATLSVTVPSGTQPGAVITMKGQGIPRLDGRGRGSLVVVVQVDVPKALSGRARELLAELDAELRGAEAEARAEAREGEDVARGGRRAAAGK